MFHRIFATSYDWSFVQIIFLSALTITPMVQNLSRINNLDSGEYKLQTGFPGQTIRLKGSPLFRIRSSEQLCMPASMLPAKLVGMVEFF
jgi:hypothetical protein